MPKITEVDPNEPKDIHAPVIRTVFPIWWIIGIDCKFKIKLTYRDLDFYWDYSWNNQRAYSFTV